LLVYNLTDLDLNIHVHVIIFMHFFIFSLAISILYLCYWTAAHKKRVVVMSALRCPWNITYTCYNMHGHKALYFSSFMLFFLAPIVLFIYSHSLCFWNYVLFLGSYFSFVCMHCVIVNNSIIVTNNYKVLWVHHSIFSFIYFLLSICPRCASSMNFFPTRRVDDM
jgi:hypothetical protein